MREFFKKTLKDLKAITGIRQEEFLSDDEMQLLLDGLVKTSQGKFGYIPIEAQQAEIQKQIIEDKDFNAGGAYGYGLNTRIVHKWLERICGKYWNNKLTEDDLTPEAEPVTGERREFWLNEFKKSVDQASDTFTKSVGSGSRLKKQFDEIAPTPESIRKEKEMSERYEVECCDETGNVLPGIPSFEKWIKTQAGNV